MASNNICIIGPRSSGKTTYLASLLYHQQHQFKQNKKIYYRVIAQTVETRQLQEKAESLLLDFGQKKFVSVYFTLN